MFHVKNLDISLTSCCWHPLFPIWIAGKEHGRILSYSDEGEELNEETEFKLSIRRKENEQWKPTCISWNITGSYALIGWSNGLVEVYFSSNSTLKSLQLGNSSILEIKISSKLNKALLVASDGTVHLIEIKDELNLSSVAIHVKSIKPYFNFQLEEEENIPENNNRKVDHGANEMVLNEVFISFIKEEVFFIIFKENDEGVTVSNLFDTATGRNLGSTLQLNSFNFSLIKVFESNNHLLNSYKFKEPQLV